MKFKQLLYGKEEEVFLFYTEDQIQYMAKRVIGGTLSPKEMRYLKAKTITEIQNLIIKINDSGVE
ncbi:MAG: hypothetical protein JRI26_10600 [Deltaproteobacteria bacterium]|nr:hypothetical protein [Deltaproteobacteria bacterium]